VILLLLSRALAAESPCVLRVGTSGDYAPFSTTTAAGTREGLDIDLVQRLGTDIGCEIRFVPFKWPDLNAQLESGRIDLVASGITMRPERALVGRFSRPYATSGAVALVRHADAERFATVAALNQHGVRIAVNAGGHLERVARALLPRATILPQSDNRALPQRLRDGSVQAVMTDSAEARAWLTDDLRTVGPLTHDHKALLLPAAAQDVAARVDAWLRAREDDGWLSERRAHYLGADGAMDAARAGREAVAALIRVRLELMPAVGAAKRKAGLPIEDKMQERRVLIRVAAQRPAHPVRLANVYRELINLAKVVQRAHASTPATAQLEMLRDAITRIDQQLVPEVDRAVGTASEWHTAIDDVVAIGGIDSTMRSRLANALADVAPTD
jgi:cyclohexadienyl dehydratase